ncbi:3',5'-nucleoside bisphosphate phosphatase [Luteimicrobium xylanilyticum]|uniref:3',5'-nucleoside bisphosphate phosphatase n=1 Tax=Luteimicrobium xylanilyticum TaxID=1133546 RepID=A0A5P9QAN5_9MICO|nr:3',5'-nucleoside bisphosphate phosphatase [Luteimicrobium xylanilyticum]
MHAGRYPGAVLIDLHTHSTASDGTDAPGQVVADAAAAGLDVVALTDHDTVAGWPDAAAAARANRIALVRGAELSAQAVFEAEGRERHVSVHILSYLHDPADAPLAQECERVRTARLDRARRMVDLLARDYPVDWDEIAAHTEPGATVGRPHLADALVRLGVVPDRSAAFETVLHAGSPYYVPHYAPRAVDTVRRVREAGGVPVFAHPAASVRGRTVPDDVIEELADAGLAGLEAHHRDHTPDQVDHLVGLAARLGLLVTGSSDYHGAGKPNRLAENTTAPEVLERIEDMGTLAVIRS